MAENFRNNSGFLNKTASSLRKPSVSFQHESQSNLSDYILPTYKSTSRNFTSSESFQKSNDMSRRNSSFNERSMRSSSQITESERNRHSRSQRSSRNSSFTTIISKGGNSSHTSKQNDLMLNTSFIDSGVDEGSLVSRNSNTDPNNINSRCDRLEKLIVSIQEEIFQLRLCPENNSETHRTSSPVSMDRNSSIKKSASFNSLSSKKSNASEVVRRNKEALKAAAKRELRLANQVTEKEHEIEMLQFKIKDINKDLDRVRFLNDKLKAKQVDHIRLRLMHQKLRGTLVVQEDNIKNLRDELVYRDTHTLHDYEELVEKVKRFTYQKENEYMELKAHLRANYKRV